MDINVKNTAKIIDKYKPLILSSISKYYFGCDFNEAYDFSIHVVIECIANYYPSKGSFGSYLKSSLKFAFFNEGVKDFDCVDITDEKYSNFLLSSKNYDEISLMELNYIIKSKLKYLNDLQRNIIYDFYFNGYSTGDIAIMYGKSYQTIANNKSIALRKLNECFKEDKIKFDDLI